MALKTPIFLENDTTTQNADELRLEREGLFMSRGGALTAAGFKVSQRGAGANMSVDVAAGGAIIDGTENALQGFYHLYNDATVNLVVAAADITNPRKDLVIVNVNDSFYSGGSNNGQLQVVTGTPAASPAEPSLAAFQNYLVLAMIDVPASDTSITDGQITDRRTRATAVGGVTVCLSTTRPASPFEGQLIYETDTDLVRFWNGASWISIVSAPVKTAAGSTQQHWGSYSGNTDGSANLTFNHGAGFTPSAVLLQSTSPSSGSNQGYPVVTAVTSTQVSLRYLASAGVTTSIPVAGYYLCLA